MKKSKLTDSQIIGVPKQVEAGAAVPVLCREHGISLATFYKWRAKYGGMGLEHIGRREFLLLTTVRRTDGS